MLFLGTTWKGYWKLQELCSKTVSFPQVLVLPIVTPGLCWEVVPLYTQATCEVFLHFNSFPPTTTTTWGDGFPALTGVFESLCHSKGIFFHLRPGLQKAPGLLGVQDSRTGVVGAGFHFQRQVISVIPSHPSTLRFLYYQSL